MHEKISSDTFIKYKKYIYYLQSFTYDENKKDYYLNGQIYIYIYIYIYLEISYKC